MPSARDTWPVDGPRSSGPAGQPDQRQAGGVQPVEERGGLGIVGALGVSPGERHAIAPGKGHHLDGGAGGAGADDLQADALHLLQQLAPSDDRGEHEVGQPRVLEQQRSEDLGV
jgi:hypothetical protein